MPRRSAPDPYATKVGTRLRELRAERSMSLADLADASELSKGHLSSVEHGLAAITTQTIARLAKGLEVPPLYLLTFPAEDDRDHVVELLRKLQPRDLTKLRKELQKTVQAAAKAASTAKAAAAKAPAKAKPVKA